MVKKTLLIVLSLIMTICVVAQEPDPSHLRHETIFGALTYQIHSNKSVLRPGSTSSWSLNNAAGEIYMDGEILPRNKGILGTVDATFYAVPANGYDFYCWEYHFNSSDGKHPTDTVISHNRTIYVDGLNEADHACFYLTAVFKKKYTISVDHTVGGSVSNTGITLYAGEDYTVRAIPNSNYEFIRWEINNGTTTTYSSNPNLTLSFVLKNYSITAVFAIKRYNISVSTSSSVRGTVNGGGLKTYGTSCHVSATPKSGWKFLCWKDSDGNQVSDNPNLTFTVTGSRTLIAYFERKSIRPSLDKGGINSSDNTLTDNGNIKLFPNPTTGLLTIEADDIQRIEVINMEGRTVATFSNEKYIDICHLPSGIYVIRITRAANTEQHRIVKK